MAHVGFVLHTKIPHLVNSLPLYSTMLFCQDRLLKFVNNNRGRRIITFTFRMWLVQMETMEMDLKVISVKSICVKLQAIYVLSHYL